MVFKETAEFASFLDSKDELKSFRDKFYIPVKNSKEVIYLAGNSLGLQPRSAREYLETELLDWENLGVEGHEKAKNPWLYYHKNSKKILAELTGASPQEVVAMNNLTSNLHLMMVSFYRPSGTRLKILIEKGAFSSDQYAIESQVVFHGLIPEDTIIELQPRDGEFTLRTEDVLDTIDKNREHLALVIIGGVSYYTGQLFDMESITKAGHKAGAMVGFDLAHAIGNVRLKLHEWDVDFAVWCSYKYLNSGPGSVAGIFVNERFAFDKKVKRFSGWWGHDESERFKMQKGFKAMVGADGWQLGNAPIFSMAVHQAALDLFKQAEFERLLSKSQMLTAYLESLLNSLQGLGHEFKIITPANKTERGCQLSLLFNEIHAQTIFDELIKSNIVVDMRKPSVIRVAPVPIYNSFKDVFEFYNNFKRILENLTTLVI